MSKRIDSRRYERLYHIYYGMRERCYNFKNHKYNLYGGKGIKICEEWLNDYLCFKEWSYANGYSEDIKGISIDRIDSDKDYEPNNCQWISISENSAKANRGRHKNKHKHKSIIGIRDNGEVIEIINISDFCRKYNLGRSSVSHRINGIIKNNRYKDWKFMVED